MSSSCVRRVLFLFCLYHKRCSHRFTSFWHNSAISKSHKFTTGDTHFSAQPYGCRSHKSTSKQKTQTLSSNARWTHPTESEMTASCLQDFCCNFACFWVRLHRRNFFGNPLISSNCFGFCQAVRIFQFTTLRDSMVIHWILIYTLVSSHLWYICIAVKRGNFSCWKVICFVLIYLFSSYNTSP